MKFGWIVAGIGVLLASFLLAWWFIPSRAQGDLAFAREFVWLRESGIDVIVESGADLPDLEMLFEESKEARRIPPEDAAQMSMPEMTLQSEDVDFEFAQEQWRAFRKLPKPEQRRIQAVYQQFMKLTSSQQQEVRDWVQQWLNFSDEERAQLRHRLQKWHRLSPTEKDEARERWAAPPGP